MNETNKHWAQNWIDLLRMALLRSALAFVLGVLVVAAGVRSNSALRSAVSTIARSNSHREARITVLKLWAWMRQDASIIRNEKRPGLKAAATI